MKLPVTPQQYLAIKRLADECEYLGRFDRPCFDESKWLSGVGQILGREIAPGTYEVEVHYS